MKWLRIILIPLLPLILGFSLWFGFDTPDYFVYSAIACLLIIDVCIGLFLPRQLPPFLIVSFSLPPFLIMLLGFCMAMIIEDSPVMILVALINSILLFLFLLYLYIFLYKESWYQVRAIPNITGHMNTLSCLYASILLFAGQYFLPDQYAWYLLIPYALVLGLLLMQTAWVNELKLMRARGLLVAIFLTTLQLAAALYLFPTMYYLNGFLVGTWYYVCVHLGFPSLKNESTRGEIVRTIVIAILMVILVLATTRWR